jgi:hypothetical protein
MGVIQKQIAHLMQQINAIREKAAEAEAIVKSITQDVQRLDVAKRNLTRTMQTLERWSMLSESALRPRLPSSPPTLLLQLLPRLSTSVSAGPSTVIQTGPFMGCEKTFSRSIEPSTRSPSQ